MQEIEVQMNIIIASAIVSKTNVRGNITNVSDEFVKWSRYWRKELMSKSHGIAGITITKCGCDFTNAMTKACGSGFSI